jgi:putative oxidoreductase|tara:strand:- start:4457 stop:4849 length:393 start_codon:yes stop_codon:yes gene_type:complete
MHIVEVFGRIFISALFLVETIKKFLNPDMSMMYMSDHGVPEFLFYPSLAFEFIFPLLLIAGYKTRIVASLLALFVLTVTLIFHSHYIVVDSMQLTIFLKNFAIIGGLLVIISNKPKICSIDYYLESKKGN